MFLIDHLILLSAVLILIGVFASKLSARFGLPLLVLFLGIGMLAGEDGIGGIAFDNASAAHALGTIALIFILFDGGLQTTRESAQEGGLLLYKQKDEDPLAYEKIAQDEIKKNMLRSNRAPSLNPGSI